MFPNRTTVWTAGFLSVPWPLVYVFRSLLFHSINVTCLPLDIGLHIRLNKDKLPYPYTNHYATLANRDHVNHLNNLLRTCTNPVANPIGG